MNVYGRRANDINLTELVRSEVRAAIKEMLAQTFAKEATSQISSGDYTNGNKQTPLDDTLGKPVTLEVMAKQSTLPVVVKRSNGTIEQRRAKRTQAEMKEAIAKALPVVQEKHPDWSERRVRRLAKNLVRRYKI